MKISTEIHSAAKIVGEEKAIELIAKAGFDAWDFSMFLMCKYDWKSGVLLPNDHPLAGNEALSFARRLKRIGLDFGIHCNQSHAPFPSTVGGIRDRLKIAIECTAEAGGEVCIIHPDNNKGATENAEMYFELLPFAKECGVKIATENMWNWDKEKNQAAPAACSSPKSFLELLNAVNDDFFVACLDIGHAEMRGLDTNSYEMIKALGGKLAALHVHDNDLWHDSHQIPFSMNIDFASVARALKEINYSGYLTLEADSYLKKFNEDTIYDGVKDLALSAKRLAEIYDKI
jgi:sugar phosphate isomerase/epimerase